MSRAGAAGAVDAEAVAVAVGEGLDGGGDFEDGIAQGGEAEAAVGGAEEFGFDHAAVVG